LRFLVVSMLQSAVNIKNMGYGKESFLDLAGGIWDSMMINDPQELREAIMSVVKKEVKKIAKEYEKSNE